MFACVCCMHAIKLLLAALLGNSCASQTLGPQPVERLIELQSSGPKLDIGHANQPSPISAEGSNACSPTLPRFLHCLRTENVVSVAFIYLTGLQHRLIVGEVCGEHPGAIAAIEREFGGKTTAIMCHQNSSSTSLQGLGTVRDGDM